MTETTYDIIAKNLDKLDQKLHLVAENNDFSNLWLLSGQLRGLKEDLQRLLWVELSELNDSRRYKAITKNTTGLVFSRGIFEFDAMRQAFFKRQAKAFFETEEEQQAYIDYTEEQYLEATTDLKKIYFNAKGTESKLDYRKKVAQIQSKFMEAMK